MTNLTSFSTRSARLAAIIAVLAVICCASLPSIAQPPQNPPAQQQQPTLQTGRSRSLGEQIAALNVRARQLMPVLQNEMMRLMGWVEYLALVLMMVIIVGSFVREWHENNGEGRNLFWWFGRLAVCLLLLGSGPAIIDELYAAGKEIAEGNEGIAGRAGQSMLYEFYQTHRESFNASYDKLIDGQFKVTVRGQEFAVKPIDGIEEFLGVLYDQEATVRDFNSNLNDSSYTLPRLFAFMSIARGVMEAGDVWLVVLAGMLLMTFKMTAPLMIVLGIDRKISQRTVHAYLWGLIILTLVWPSVSYFIRGLAYMAGNAAMAMGDGDQVYAWTDATMKALRNPLAQPFYTIIFGSLMMLGAGLALWVSPLFAYSFAMGRVFETVTQTASQYAGSIIGAAIEWYSANIGAKIARQAENVQIQGGYEAETARARGELQAANMSARARQIMSAGQAKGQQIISLSQVYASRDNQVLSARANLGFGIASAQAQRDMAVADLGVRTNQQIGELKIGQQQQTATIEVDRAAETQRWVGDKVMMASGYAGYVLRNKGKGDDGKASLPARGLATVIEIGGGAYGLSQQYSAIQNRAGGQVDALNKATVSRVEIQQQAQQQFTTNQNAYLNRVTDAQQQLSDGIAHAANISSSRAAGGINSGTAIQIGAINRGAAMEMQANQIRYDSQMKAAEITRSFGLEAANLRAMSHVISQVAGKVARDIEKNIEMRF
ncbi:MAG: hypothetical protein MOB07_29880 [Acidobacteria bacterium]|nr:hypothetical protein [Acidobacteriota bacterium]